MGSRNASSVAGTRAVVKRVIDRVLDLLYECQAPGDLGRVQLERARTHGGGVWVEGLRDPRQTETIEESGYVGEGDARRLETRSVPNPDYANRIAVMVPAPGELGRWKGIEEEDAGDLAELGSLCGLLDREAVAVAQGAAQGRGQSNYQRLISLCAEVRWVRDYTGALYAVAGGRVYVVGGRGDGLERWLVGRYADEVGDAPAATSLAAAMGRVIEVGEDEAELADVGLRVAGDGEQRVCLHLGGDRVAECTADGWRTMTVAASKVYWRTGSGLGVLPEPIRGGSLLDLGAYLRLAPDALPLALGWVLGACRPRGPYPLLVLTGHAGVGKTMTARALRGLVDPSGMPERLMPSSVPDLVVGALGQWLVSLDNVSRLTSDQSDWLCQLSTGLGYGARRLYSDLAEVRAYVCRPAVITAITDVVSGREDLGDRSIVLPVRAGVSLDESELRAGYERVLPMALGGLLDAVCAALAGAGAVSVPASVPTRQAGWVRWCIAAERLLGAGPGGWLAAYARARDVAEPPNVDGELVRGLLGVLGAGGGHWRGTASELLIALDGMVPQSVRRAEGWPIDAVRLSADVMRLVDALGAANIEVSRGQKDGRRYVDLRRFGDSGR